MNRPSPEITRESLESIFHLKYGDPETTGWGPRTRWSVGHFNPDDHYEALVDRLVLPGCRWLDVGCGRKLFVSNERLAKLLSARCGVLVGVDPDPTLAENPFVHEKVPIPFEEFRPETPFDLVTMRMVAEHVERPDEVARSLAACTSRGGHVVIYTVNRFSPIPLLTTLVPFRLRHPLKRFLWRTEPKDTFPTRFRMNTRRRLRNLLESVGFSETYFSYLDDCRTTSGFPMLHIAELGVWRFLRRLRLRHPENCLLGVYRPIER